MKRILSDALAGLVLALFAAVVLLSFASVAEAQATDPPPACSPWGTGKGITIAQVEHVYAATWWCPVNGKWLEQRAAAILPEGTDAKQRAIEAINANDMARLVKNRDTSLNDPRFAPVFASMAAATAAKKPK